MVGIIGAMDMEVNGLIQQMDQVSREETGAITFYSGKIAGKEVVTAKCGAGKVNASMCAQAMILAFRPDFIINSGVAGGVEKNMKVCDCAVAEAVCQHDVDLSPLGDPVGMIPAVKRVNIPCDFDIVKRLAESAERILPERVYRGVIATGDSFINDETKVWELREKFSAVACEMEGGAIGQVCYLNQVPFGVLRTISDGGDADSHLSFEEFAERAANISVSIMLDFVKNM